jgi:hypothetical protein
MTSPRVDELEAENRLLRERVTQLEIEITFLRTHPVFLQGLKGETLIAKLTGGILTSFAAQYDLKVGENVRVEIKFSKINTPVLGSPTRRWNWSKPLGWKDKGKDFDFLILVGEKDLRYPEQYVDTSPYIYFFIPRVRVPEIVTRGASIGANVQITTNLSKALSPASIALKSFVVSGASIAPLLENAHPA